MLDMILKLGDVASPRHIAFLGPQVFELNPHAIWSNDTDYSGRRTQGRRTGLKFQTDRDKGYLTETRGATEPARRQG